MNLWIMFILSIISLQNFACNQVFAESQKWKAIKKDLDTLEQDIRRSKYWARNYKSDLSLYTAKIDDYTETCIQPIFYCYCAEIKVVLEEMKISGDEKEAKELGNRLDHMRANLPSKNKLPDGCKKCEEYEEKSFNEFIDSFKTLAQKMNS
ncbi:interleukin-15 isoform X2 [Hyla sarda]|uniref:interleukin-15 isoform X2 n=1 Tax=Hyla sarda TaxID=327740 RepID=UPI0024C2B4E8|nr:interleukin-15 isoform X2 [Hyla sarda]